jgi:hypothetical protein
VIGLDQSVISAMAVNALLLFATILEAIKTIRQLLLVTIELKSPTFKLNT